MGDAWWSIVARSSGMEKTLVEVAMADDAIFVVFGKFSCSMYFLRWRHCEIGNSFTMFEHFRVARTRVSVLWCCSYFEAVEMI